MATPKQTVWEIDPHTLAKHEILRHYLRAWFPILNSHHSRIVYIDGFSGPGRYSCGEQGSPIIALEVASTHRKSLEGELVFWFIDEKPDRVAHLREELKAMTLPAHFKVFAECGTFHEELSKALDSMAANSPQPSPLLILSASRGFHLPS